MISKNWFGTRIAFIFSNFCLNLRDILCHYRAFVEKGVAKQRWQVRNKSILYYWANREMEISMSELFRRLKVSVMAISNAVQLGEKIVKELDLSFIEPS